MIADNNAMDKVTVLILNYQSYIDTINYVKNIQNQKKININILIVDNFSLNDSYNILLKKFKDCQNVQVIQSDRNGGYAYGNNYGLHYLQHVDVDYILISNNDIVIDDNLLLYKLINSYKKLYKPAFVAPIMHVNNIPSPYAAWKIPTKTDGIIGTLGLLQKIFGDKTRYNFDEENSTLAVDCLPGSFFMAKKEVYYDIGLMDEGTFLYMEECILAYKVKQHKLINYLIRTSSYEHLVSKTISSHLSSTKMRLHFNDSRIYFFRNYLKMSRLGIGLIKCLFQLCKIENYFYRKAMLMRGKS